MSGETDIDKLMASFQPILDPETYVFASLDGDMPSGIAPRMIFEEAEGITVILTQAEAMAAGIPHEFPCRMITLNVHSALEAVGFLARIIPALADAGMGVNPVAGFYHDHLFVPDDRADDAMAVLQSLAKAA